jgi:hypothetical protein
MNKRTLLSLAAAALVVFSATACETRDTQTLTDVAPRADLLDFNSGKRIEKLAPAAQPVSGSTASAVIGRWGGKLRNGDHVLLVPIGAVLEDTEFTMTSVPGSYIQVDLQARRVRDGATISTFPVQLTLRLDYKNAAISDPDRLAVAYLVDGTPEGRKQVVGNNVNTTGKWVSASLSHFSFYAVGID